MDESFVEVMKQYRRMCAVRYSGCLSCELASANNGKNVSCRDLIMKHPEDAERIIMKWADEHPEPQYPTWMQWQNKMFPDHDLVDGHIFPCVFISKDRAGCKAYVRVGVIDESACERCILQRIPSDIAEKLGIKPGKEWE